MKEFVNAYRAALERWRGGNWDVVFPAGTYALARKGLVKVADEVWDSTDFW